MWTEDRQENENPIDARAIAWVARLDRGSLAASERAELDAWLAADARHRGAFLRARAGWKNFDRLGILAGEPETGRPSPVSRRRLLAGASGAAIAATAAVFFVLEKNNRFETPRGEIRHVPLADGTLVAINTDSTLNVSLKPEIREIMLGRGEAWFAVARDRTRPFIVAAGKVRVRAVGTAFCVRRHDDGADVLVTEGTVETWTVDAAARRERVSAGSRVYVSDIAGPSPAIAAPAQIDRLLAWRSGEIALAGDTLAYAAKEFNRYNDRRLTIDPALADKRLVGWFRADEPEVFARAAAITIGATVVTSGDEIHMAPK